MPDARLMNKDKKVRLERRQQEQQGPLSPREEGNLASEQSTRLRPAATTGPSHKQETLTYLDSVVDVDTCE